MNMFFASKLIVCKISKYFATKQGVRGIGYRIAEYSGLPFRCIQQFHKV
jgi:hypothetical protein